MVDAARQKALFRAKLNASKKEKRIEDPLVRYNENDQPVCRVCDFVLKSDSHWPAHQASRKHHEAINTYRANAAALNRANNAKQPEASTELPNPKAERPIHLQNNKTENSTGLAKPRSSSVLPSDFFDNREAKRQKNGTTSASLGDPESHTKLQGSSQSQVMELFDSENKTNGLSSVNVMEPKSHEILPAMEKTQTSNMIVGSESKNIKGALPEGFFDDKDSDLRARGITPVKPDVKDEYKEFEKLIQEDLREVDNRLEEEEYDAAETIEEAESVEQRAYKERVERLKRKKMELKAARSATHSRGAQVLGKESSSDESSSDDNSEENFAVDWRAKHL